ncbi:MAG: hypothetical protein AAB489_02165 [Patescibacteria group bacterium]
MAAAFPFSLEIESVKDKIHELDRASRDVTAIKFSCALQHIRSLPEPLRRRFRELILQIEDTRERIEQLVPFVSPHHLRFARDNMRMLLKRSDCMRMLLDIEEDDDDDGDDSSPRSPIPSPLGEVPDRSPAMSG